MRRIGINIRITIINLQLATMISGPDDAPVIIFNHAFPLNNLCGYTDGCFKRDYRVVV
jgi:hypothetical protein